MTVTPPANVGYGTVAGRFILDMPDSVDVDDDPDYAALSGAVAFTINVPEVRDVTASPDPVTILRNTIVGLLDSEGYLCTPDPIVTSIPGVRDLRLIANDDPDLNPTGTQYTATFALVGPDGRPRAKAPIRFQVLEGETIDLTLVGDVPSAAPLGTAAAEAAAAAAAASAAIAAGALVDSTAFVRSTVATDIATPGSAIETEVSANYGALEPTRMMTTAELIGFRPVGFDAATDTLYMLSDGSNTQLYSNGADPTLRTVIPLNNFGGTTTIRYCWVLASGAILCLVAQTGGAQGDLWRSTDGGVTFAKVITDMGGPSLSGLARNLCQTQSGAIIYCEYNALPASSTYKTWRSTDDGATFTTMETFVNYGLHIHGCFSDPFVANRVWRCFGDSNANQTGPRIEYSDDFTTAAAGTATWTIIGSGGQTWRSVDLLFTADEVFFAADGIEIDTPIYAWNRTTGERRILLDSGGTTFFYGIDDGADHFAFVTGTYLPSDEVKVWVGNLSPDNYVRPTQAFSAYPHPTTVRLDQWLYGPDAHNGIYFGISDNTSTSRTSLIRRCLLTSGDENVTNEIALTDGASTVKRPYLLVGPDPGAIAASTLSMVINREYMIRFTAPREAMNPVVAITLMNGGTVAGNTSVGIRECQLNGTPGVMRSASPAVAQAGVNLEQKFTLARPLTLIPGKDYWLSVVNSTSGGLVVGCGNVSFRSTLVSCQTSAATTVPAATTPPVIATNGSRISALLTTS